MKEEDISINVNIADVVYPLRIKASQQDGIRKAEKMINERIRALKDDYQITDKQILLSMLSLQLAGEVVQQEQNSASYDNGVIEQIQHIDKLLDSALHVK